MARAGESNYGYHYQVTFKEDGRDAFDRVVVLLTIKYQRRFTNNEAMVLAAEELEKCIIEEGRRK